MAQLTATRPANKVSRPKPVRVVRFRAPSRPGNPAILDIVQTEGRRTTQTSFFLSAVPTDFGAAAYHLEKFTIDQRGEGDESYHVHFLPDGTATCECRGFLRWGHCLHGEELTALRASGQLVCLRTPAEQEHARFFGDTSDLGDEKARAEEQARIAAASAAWTATHDAPTDDCPF